MTESITDGIVSAEQLLNGERESLEGLTIIELADRMTDGTTVLPESGGAAGYIIAMFTDWLRDNGYKW